MALGQCPEQLSDERPAGKLQRVRLAGGDRSRRCGEGGAEAYGGRRNDKSR